MSKFSKTELEVLPTTTGDGWRVRIVEQDRTQYINGFEFASAGRRLGCERGRSLAQQAQAPRYRTADRISSLSPGEVQIQAKFISKSNTPGFGDIQPSCERGVHSRPEHFSEPNFATMLRL